MKADKSKTAFDGVKRGSVFWFDPEDLVIRDEKDDPLFDPRGLEAPDPAMVAGIKTYGILQPITVIKADGDPVVVAGRRRVLACRQANVELKEAGLPPKLVPAVFRHESGKEALPLMIVENSHRRDEPVMAKARKARSALNGGYEESQVAEMFGVSASTLRNWLTLLEDCSAPVQAAVEKGSVTMVSAVKKLAKLPKAEQAAALGKLEAERPTMATSRATGKPTKRVVSPMARLKRFETFVDGGREPCPHEILMFIGWLRGEIADKALAHRFPVLAGMFEKGKA